MAFVAALALAAHAQTILKTIAGIPASLTVFADAGDLTYCVLKPLATPSVSLTCRRSGVTRLTPATISSSAVVSIGDIAWSFVFDQANPKLVHFQASVNQRDQAGANYYLPSGTVTGEFAVKETVTNPAGATAIVTHWSQTAGVIYADGQNYPTTGGNLTVTGLTAASPLAVGDQLTGMTSGATGTIASISPVTGSSVKSAGDIAWP